MNRFFKFSVFFAMLIHLLSCTPGAPYEIKSPCVSIESQDDATSMTRNPCVRRPINSRFDVASVDSCAKHLISSSYYWVGYVLSNHVIWSFSRNFCFFSSLILVSSWKCKNSVFRVFCRWLCFCCRFWMWLSIFIVQLHNKLKLKFIRSPILEEENKDWKKKIPPCMRIIKKD